MSRPAPRQIAKSPEKGVFPLDHFGECKKMADVYLSCINQHDGNADPCLELSKQYLKCRMERNLMAKQDLQELGLGPEAGQQVEKSQ